MPDGSGYAVPTSVVGLLARLQEFWMVLIKSAKSRARPYSSWRNRARRPTPHPAPKADRLSGNELPVVQRTFTILEPLPAVPVDPSGVGAAGHRVEGLAAVRGGSRRGSSGRRCGGGLCRIKCAIRKRHGPHHALVAQIRGSRAECPTAACSRSYQLNQSIPFNDTTGDSEHCFCHFQGRYHFGH